MLRGLERRGSIPHRCSKHSRWGARKSSGRSWRVATPRALSGLREDQLTELMNEMGESFRQYEVDGGIETPQEQFLLVAQVAYPCASDASIPSIM